MMVWPFIISKRCDGLTARSVQNHSNGIGHRARYQMYRSSRQQIVGDYVWSIIGNSAVMNFWMDANRKINGVSNSTSLFFSNRIRPPPLNVQTVTRDVKHSTISYRQQQGFERDSSHYFL